MCAQFETFFRHLFLHILKNFAFLHILANFGARKKNSPIIIVNIPLREQRPLVAQNAIDVNHRALLVQGGRSQYLEPVQRPEALVVLVQVREFDEVIVRVAVQVLLVECGERFARHQVLEDELFQAVFVDR